jgi:hypothetical protein
MPDITETEEALKVRYRNERRIELAFEDLRMWDVRRWVIGSKGYENARGVTIIYKMDPVSHETASVPIITPREFETRTWLDKAYFFPIPRTEMNRNDQLIQNPGY